MNYRAVLINYFSNYASIIIRVLSIGSISIIVIALIYMG